MIKISEKILQLNKPNGTFIVFVEYDNEQDFSNFLAFIRQKIAANVTENQQHPYSNTAKIKFPFGEATAIYQEGIGCAIRVEPSNTNVVENIVKVLVDSNGKV